MSYLYAIQLMIPGQPQPIKIGFSADPSERIKTITAAPFPMVLLGKWPAPSGIADEYEAHSRLKAHRMNGEWFYPASAVLEFLRERGVRPHVASNYSSLRDPFEIGVDSDVRKFLTLLESAWPRACNSRCFLRAKDVAELLNMPIQLVRDRITPCRFGRVQRYAFELVQAFFEDEPHYVDKVTIQELAA